MERFLFQFNKWPFVIRFSVVTVYIALVNSYALFIVYPSLKTTDVIAIAISLALYVLLTLPLLVYVAKKFQPRPQLGVVGIGFLAMVSATLLQYFISHPSLPMLIVHMVFYLFAGVIEETLWRGKLWQLVSERVKNQLSVIAIVTVHFVILHIPFALLYKQVPIIFIGQLVALGITLGLLRLVTKKITIPSFAHAIVNMVVYT